MKSYIIHLRKSEAKSKTKQGSDQKVGRTAHKASAEIIFPRDRGMNDLETGILKMALVKNTSVRVDPRRMKIIKKVGLTVVNTPLNIKVETSAITFPVSEIRRAFGYPR